MSNRRSSVSSFSIISLILTLLLVLSTSCWGEPSFKIIFENQTEYDLTVYVNDYKVGNVNPGEQIIDTGLSFTTTKFHVEANSPRGEIIFSETMTREQMQEIESRVYKVIIKQPSQDSDNITGKNLAIPAVAM